MLEKLFLVAFVGVELILEMNQHALSHYLVLTFPYFILVINILHNKSHPTWPPPHFLFPFTFPFLFLSPTLLLLPNMVANATIKGGASIWLFHSPWVLVFVSNLLPIPITSFEYGGRVVRFHRVLELHVTVYRKLLRPNHEPTIHHRMLSLIHCYLRRIPPRLSG